jgi:hypothetical protein
MGVFAGGMIGSARDRSGGCTGPIRGTVARRLAMPAKIVHMELATGDRFGDVALRGESEPALAFPGTEAGSLSLASLL